MRDIYYLSGELVQWNFSFQQEGTHKLNRMSHWYILLINICFECIQTKTSDDGHTQQHPDKSTHEYSNEAKTPTLSGYNLLIQIHSALYLCMTHTGDNHQINHGLCSKTAFYGIVNKVIKLNTSCKRLKLLTPYRVSDSFAMKLFAVWP